jgi:hypothetical protein
MAQTLRKAQAREIRTGYCTYEEASHTSMRKKIGRWVPRANVPRYSVYAAKGLVVHVTFQLSEADPILTVVNERTVASRMVHVFKICGVWLL